MNRKQRRAQARQQKPAATALPRLEPDSRARVAAVWSPLVDVSAPEYEPRRDEDRVTKAMLEALQGLTDEELAVASSTADALQQLCGAVMTWRLTESFAAAVTEAKGTP